MDLSPHEEPLWFDSVEPAEMRRAPSNMEQSAAASRRWPDFEDRLSRKVCQAASPFPARPSSDNCIVPLQLELHDF